MSSDALAVVQRFFDLAAAGDFEAITEILDPEVVWFGTVGGLDEHRVIRGPDACIAYMREIEEPWERLEVAVERLIEADDAVVALLREAAAARGGDLELRNETAMLFRVQRQKIVEARGYLRRDEALTASGLPA
jgi:ketosteroid isomerase-like protein